MSEFRCEECGRFISYKDAEARQWTYYGNTYDLDPPDPVECCGKCWLKKSDDDLESLKKICWMGPHYLNSVEQLHELGEL